MAYLVFRETGCSRVKALQAVSALAEQFPAIATLAVKRWRSRKRRSPSPTKGEP
jgi:hypothetical protein